MKKIARLLLRIPYFYYWSWKRYPYNFELWLSLYVSYDLANFALKNLKLIVPKEYRDFIIKYPDFKPFSGITELRGKSVINKQFYHYETKKE